MDCCQCRGIEQQFDQGTAEQKLAAYRASGPERTTQLLIDALRQDLRVGGTLLDIGGGVGAIQHALLRAGLHSAISVDASRAYSEVARSEAERQGFAERITHYHANFVDLAADLPQADIVTLDRVICCYHDMPALVANSAAKAQRCYGLVYPRDTWWMVRGAALINGFFWLQRTPFRLFAHRTTAIDDVVAAQGLQPRYRAHTLLWNIVVYARQLQEPARDMASSPSS